MKSELNLSGVHYTSCNLRLKVCLFWSTPFSGDSGCLLLACPLMLLNLETSGSCYQETPCQRNWLTHGKQCWGLCRKFKKEWEKEEEKHSLLILHVSWLRTVLSLPLFWFESFHCSELSLLWPKCRLQIWKSSILSPTCDRNVIFHLLDFSDALNSHVQCVKVEFVLRLSCRSSACHPQMSYDVIFVHRRWEDTKHRAVSWRSCRAAHWKPGVSSVARPGFCCHVYFHMKEPACYFCVSHFANSVFHPLQSTHESEQYGLLLITEPFALTEW